MDAHFIPTLWDLRSQMVRRIMLHPPVVMVTKAILAVGSVVYSFSLACTRQPLKSGKGQKLGCGKKKNAYYCCPVKNANDNFVINFFFLHEFFTGQRRCVCFKSRPASLQLPQRDICMYVISILPSKVEQAEESWQMMHHSKPFHLFVSCFHSFTTCAVQFLWIHVCCVCVGGFFLFCFLLRMWF